MMHQRILLLVLMAIAAGAGSPCAFALDPNPDGAILTSVTTDHWAGSANTNSDGAQLNTLGIYHAGGFFKNADGATVRLGMDSADFTPPEALITLAGSDPTARDAVAFDLTFNEPVMFDAGAIQLIPGSLQGTIGVTDANPVFTILITLNDPDADGVVGITLAPDAITDISGNPCPEASSPWYTIHNWPGLSIEPENTRAYLGDAHTFEVAGDFDPITPTYQWKWETPASIVYDGPTVSEWLLSPILPERAGYYWCQITYDGDVHETTHAELRVAAHIEIVNPPDDATVAVGESHTFQVTASGGFTPLNFVWKKGDVIVGSGPALTLNSIQSSHAGTYSVYINDAFTDERVLSALLTVIGAEGEGQGEGGTVEGEGSGEGMAEGEGAAEGEGNFDMVHTADQDGDYKITLTELLRVIQLFNLRGYSCADPPSSTEDGYLPGPGTDHTCVAHDSDYNLQDWSINLTELLRLIQFFNLRGYHPCPGQGTEDGFCPGA